MISEHDRKMYALAVQMSKASDCERRQVGAIVAGRSYITGSGYNGAVMIDHECMRKNSRSGKDLDKCPAIHAEADAIIDYFMNGGRSSKNTTLYTSSIIPCKDCSNLIVMVDIKRIVCSELVFYDEWSKRILLENEIEVWDIEGAHL